MLSAAAAPGSLLRASRLLLGRLEVLGTLGSQCRGVHSSGAAGAEGGGSSSSSSSSEDDEAPQAPGPAPFFDPAADLDHQEFVEHLAQSALGQPKE